MDQLLQEISNLTRGAQDKVVYLRDSETQAQKSSPGNIFFPGDTLKWHPEFFSSS